MGIVFPRDDGRKERYCVRQNWKKIERKRDMLEFSYRSSRRKNRRMRRRWGEIRDFMGSVDVVWGAGGNDECGYWADDAAKV